MGIERVPVLPYGDRDYRGFLYSCMGIETRIEWVPVLLYGDRDKKGFLVLLYGDRD